ncbi:MAG: carboxypeptidase-like regulatory domain-containing protein, partial [Acidobacteriota bacterium]
MAAGTAAIGLWTPAVQGRVPQASGGCRIGGRAAASSTPLPGVAVIVRSGGSISGATSTEPDGTFHLAIAPGTYQLSAELTGFTAASAPLHIIEGQPCPAPVNFQLALAPRGSVATGHLGALMSGTPAPSSTTVASSSVAPSSSPVAPGHPGAVALSSAAGGRGAGAGPQRFAPLNLQAQAVGSAPVEEEPDAAARLLLPPGFSTESPMQALAVNGAMASIDRGMLNDRLDAIGRGEFDPATGEFGQGFGPGAGRGGGGGPSGGAGGRGGAGGG